MRIGLVACLVFASCSAARERARPGRIATANRPASAAPESMVEPADAARDVLNAHNAIRANHRRSPFRLNPELCRAAQLQAQDMARRGRMSHRGSDGSTPFERMQRAGYRYNAGAENVAFGIDQVAAVMGGWMRSPGHRRNILGPYGEIGVGRAIATDGASFWCVTFGSTVP